MTTEKQSAANKMNGKKSTGAKTAKGKEAVAQNALKHGLLSRKSILAGENADEFSELLKSLIDALSPSGVLEQILVEKVAIAIWKQKRLAAAESASIELGRMMESRHNQNAVNKALNLDSGLEEHSFKMEDLTPLTDDESESIPWCKDVVAEFDSIDRTILEDGDLVRLAKESPLILEVIRSDANDEGVSIEDYVSGRLAVLTDDLYDWCRSRVSSRYRKAKIQDVVSLVQSSASAPMNHELLMRYSTSLDNELFRSIEALRKQQEFRLKNVAVVAEVA